jgi:hypothetical protein
MLRSADRTADERISSLVMLAESVEWSTRQAPIEPLKVMNLAFRRLETSSRKICIRKSEVLTFIDHHTRLHRRRVLSSIPDFNVL